MKQTSLAVTVGEKNIAEVTAFSIDRLQKFLNDLELTKTQTLIGNQILKEIKARIQFLMDVGLEYLTLARATGSLSGGEAHPAGYSDWFRPGRRGLYSGRAKYRPAPTGQ